jgi:hypothetical protein
MKNNTIFYAWQNDTAPDCNRYFIRKALKKALAQLSQDESIDECPRLDHDTEGVPGTPPIADTIFEKINNTKLFVGDVTYIGTSGNKRLPNPNVMIELGYAFHAVTSDRVLLIMNTAHGDNEHLPFDLRNRRFPISYSLNAGASKEQKRSVQNDLVAKLAHAIASILKIPEKPASNRNLKLHVSPMWSQNRLYAHIRLFNSGPGAIYVESWWTEWGPKGKQSSHNSIKTVRGKLPVRLEEQNATELLVEISNDVESLSGIGVIDGDGHSWLASGEELVIFKHNAITHRLPGTESNKADETSLEGIKVEVRASATKPPGMSCERLEVTFKNQSDKPVSLMGAELAWTYTPPRKVPTQPGKPSVAETGGNVTLSALSKANPLGPGEEALFILDEDMSVFLVELARGDVRDGDISIKFATQGRMGWTASMDEIPSVVRAVAKAVVERLKRPKGS